MSDKTMPTSSSSQETATTTTNTTTSTSKTVKRFKEKYSFETRLKEAQTKKEEHPELLPIIVEKHARSRLPDMEKSKFLAAKDMKLHEFQLSIKKKLKVDKKEALFFFIAGKKIDKPDSLIQDVYEANKDKDEFLYVTYSELEAYGGEIIICLKEQ